ncbi:HAD-IC family P-type ATPase [Blastococcus sp. TML/M2B]|uniref:HAD-IC family P-type ATPase n=1 Tax=unclassified Blastococcus TaxID=2619396 RepID=UPI00190DD74D|nr:MULTISPECIES: HAD-IC family P-type ATPase [unclassified Blastococcus]MBN1092818.1 HAD-IC family P-type ATPase [Blastococcus sp. TML/M2B]MBN1097075.1 HAD-IC family P-type ATPase [Blastococcus sp. TML/C7B]
MSHPGPVPVRAGEEPVTRPTGLTAAEVAHRVGTGAVNAGAARTSRTLTQILRANVFTFFNALLAVLWVVSALAGRWQNTLFGGVVVANAAIGIVQEVRAKRTLDRLAVLSAPRARPVRDGREEEVAVEQVVLDDLLVVRAGDQVPVDGVLRDGAGLSVDESLLTGEADAVAKGAGDQLLSGSVVLAGAGRMQATAVGEQAYAARLAAEARVFTRARSELQDGTNRILRWIAAGLLVVGPLVLWSQFRAEDNVDWRDAVTGTVGAMVGMIPEGLVLLTTLAFLVATLGLARRQVLVQELPAVEGLARVDVVCLDKTGTLTHGDVAFDRLEPLADGAAAPAALALLADADGGNATARALAAVFSDTGGQARADAVPFSSARKWSAVRTATGTSWVLGAPEMVLPAPAGPAQEQARARADALAAEGRRVLLLARSPQPWSGDAAEPDLPGALVPEALVVLAERIREDAAEVLRYFTEQGVALKVISGDNPRTVGAVAAAVGVPGIAGAGDAVDARSLPDDPEELGAAVEAGSVFGRVTPHQKRAMVRALQARGHVVAMTGDGVNDALALKDADIGVAMGTGAPATRAVAQLVLLDGRFAHLPHAVAEGRRVIANIERAANLFLVKNVYSLVLALVTVVTLVAYPLAPVQLTLISTLTIGVPGFFLALAPNRRRYVPGFLSRVLRFSVPIGIVIGAAAYTGYAATRWLDPGAGVAEGRTTATVVVLVVALWTLVVLARPLTPRRVALIGTMAGLSAGAVALPTVRTDVLLLEPTAQGMAVAAALGVVAGLLVELVGRRGGLPSDGVSDPAADRRPGDRGVRVPGVGAQPTPRGTP